MKINAKGQVTIPAEIRRSMGLLPGTKVKVVFSGKSIYIEKSAGRPKPKRGPAKLMRGKRHIKMTTEEIMALMNKD